MWAVCDLAVSLLFSKTTNFELKEFPAQLSLSLLYFKAHPSGDNFVNSNLYIPQEMVYQPPKKSGGSIYVPKKGPTPAVPNKAAAVKPKSRLVSTKVALTHDWKLRSALVIYRQ